MLAALGWGAYGCGPAAGPGFRGAVPGRPNATEPLSMTYLGTGGWILEHAGVQILTAPLFSNPSFVSTGLAEISSDTAAVDRFMGRYDVSDARAILIGHAHYDHLMDVPRVALAHAPSARILGSRTVANTLGTWSGVGHRVDTLEAFAGDVESVGRWMPVSPQVRVMPLRSLHGPHFDGLTLYKGTVDRPRSEEPEGRRSGSTGRPSLS